MKLILHIGPPKTGTTSLQHSLYTKCDRLIEKGVLYPNPLLDGAYNHGRLCAIFVPYSDAPRGMKDVGEADYIKNGDLLRAGIIAQTKEDTPETLILSSEWFARAQAAKDGRKLIEFAESLGPDSIEILLYARRPSGFFLSAAQQRLRASSLFEPIFEWNVNELIDGFRALAPQATVTVRTFDRQALLGGSIISDFASTYIPMCKDILEGKSAKPRPNESFSAETMAILQDFRRTEFPGQEDVFNKRTRRIRAKLQKLDTADGNPRPTLRPEWEEYLDYGDDRALKLRDAHGISFSDFDYARLEQGNFAPKPSKSKDVADLVNIDKERMRSMIGMLRKDLWLPVGGNAKWLRDLASRIDSVCE